MTTIRERYASGVSQRGADTHGLRATDTAHPSTMKCQAKQQSGEERSCNAGQAKSKGKSLTGKGTRRAELTNGKADKQNQLDQCRKRKGVEGRRTTIVHADGSREEYLLATAVDCRRWRRGKILHCMLCLFQLSNLSNGQQKAFNKAYAATDRRVFTIRAACSFSVSIPCDFCHARRDFISFFSRWICGRESRRFSLQDSQARCRAIFSAICRSDPNGAP